MSPLIYLYTRLMRLLGFGVRLAVCAVISGVVLAVFHLSGVWDVQHSRLPPIPVQQFLKMGHWNPFVRVEAALFGHRSSWQRVQTTTRGLRPMRVQPLIPAQPWWRTVWHWASVDHPLAANPYPHLRQARWHDSTQLALLLCRYYLSTLVGAGIVGVGVLCVWVSLCVRSLTTRPRPSRSTTQLRDDDLHTIRMTLTVPMTSMFRVPLPPSVIQFAAASPTAKHILEMLVAHNAWPASLAHHGAQAGGLLAHTLRTFALAQTHDGARDPKLGRAFLLAVLSHDVGKILAYERQAHGTYLYRSFYHANKSADLLIVACIYQEFATDIADAVVVALRASASKSLTPVPDNGPAAARTLLGWLQDVDRLGISQDVEDLKSRVTAEAVRALLPALFVAPAPSPDLPAPLYQDGGSPYLIRESARAVVIARLGLEQHPAVSATLGRRDPVWQALKGVLHDAGASDTEEKLQLVGRERPFVGLAVPEHLVEENARART